MGTMENVRVELGQAAYDIHIQAGLLESGQWLREHIHGNQVFVVSNQCVADYYLPALRAQLLDYQLAVHLMPDGESFKTLTTLEAIIGALLEQGFNRSVTIIALGGGVVGDTAGFAAASYQRGVPFIQIPTTLLSQVDSSVGGKTAVNHALGKNMIGAFYQPQAVLIDTRTLQTLPDRELSAGLAEVIKHGVLASADYFDMVEDNIASLRVRDEALMAATIKGSCEIKAAVVAADEKERGQRALLNFGHTFGHAIETGLGYGAWLHGEAVGAGMVMAADLSLRLGRCSSADALRIKALVHQAGLPVELPGSLDESTMLRLMSKDKKTTDDGLRFVLLDGGIGRSALVDNVPEALLVETLRAGKRLCEG